MAKKIITYIFVIASLMTIFVCSVYAADYTEDVLPISDYAEVSTYKGLLKSNIGPVTLGTNTIIFTDHFIEPRINFFVDIFFTTDITIKQDVTNAYIYIDISDINFVYGQDGKVNHHIFLDRPAGFIINGQEEQIYNTSFDKDGKLMYKIPVKKGDVITQIRLTSIMSLDSNPILNQPSITYNLNAMQVMYSQTDADRVIQALKEQTPEDKQQVTDDKNKVDQSIEKLESQASAIEGLERPEIEIEKNPVDIASTGIPTLISHITNHPYVVALFALLASLVMIAALLYGV